MTKPETHIEIMMTSSSTGITGKNNDERGGPLSPLLKCAINLTSSKKPGTTKIIVKAACVELANKAQMYNANLIPQLRHSVIPANIRIKLTAKVIAKGSDKSICNSLGRL